MPPSAQHFTPVWPVYEAQQTFRSKQYAPAKKRKRRRSEEESEEEDDETPQPTNYTSTIKAELPSIHDRIALRGEARKDPFNIAGHPKGEPLPVPPFPHGPIKSKKPPSEPNSTQIALAALKPPLYTPPPNEDDHTTSLRRQHLNVLTTILHTSLLKSDFVRAGRAWGLILRSEMRGIGIDVRTHGRWGIGAEILLRQHATPSRQHENNADHQTAEDEDEYDNDLSSTATIGDEGFAAAKAYYERLILQYPYHKTHPNQTSALTFYPAMFGLCIAEIGSKCQRALRSDSDPRSDHEDHDSDDADSKANAVKRAELSMARDLTARMDELMLSPPYDTYPPLLQLRAMVALWVGDLCKDVLARTNDDEAANKESADREGEKAERRLRRLRDAGCEIPELVEHILKV